MKLSENSGGKLPELGAYKIVSHYVTFVSGELKHDFIPGEIIWIIGNLNANEKEEGYTYCCRALSRLGVGIVANAAINEFAVML